MSALWGGPTYRAASPAEMMQAAFDLPMSQGATFWDQAKGGALESFGLGTKLRDYQTPDLALKRIGEERQDYETRLESMPGVLDEDAYKSSPYFRTEIPWDQGMTEDRAAALATMYDQRKVREFFAEKRPFTSFIGNLSGQALDPINYIPVAGQAVRAANIARFGRVAGTALTASLDAAANTAIAGLATRETRGSFGDDISWQRTVSEIAMAALIGGAFGTIGGALGARADAKTRAALDERLSTLRNTQEARIALNEAIDGLANDGEVRLSPNGVAGVSRVAQEVASLSRAYDQVLADPKGDPLDPLVRIAPEDIEGTLVGRGAFEDISGTEFSRAGFGLLKIIWRHGERGSDGPGYRVTKEDVLALPEVVRGFEPIPGRTDGGREWRVERNGRQLVYVDKPMRGDRHVVTVYVQHPRAKGSGQPLSEKKEPVAAGSPSNVLSVLQDTTEQTSSRLAPGRPLPATGNIARSVAVDNRTPATDPVPAGRVEAEHRASKPETYKGLAEQYRVDPETASFPEEQEIALLEREGRLTTNDASALEEAQSTYEDSAAYGEALKSLVSCII